MSTQADFNAVLALIALASDPARARAHIEEISRHSADAERAASDRAAANKTLTQARAVSDEHKAHAAKRDEAHAAQVAALDAEKTRLAQFDAALKTKDAEISEREQRVASERKNLVAREQTLAERAEKVSAQEAAWAEKARRIHEAAA